MKSSSDKDTCWFKHDNNARRDPKIQALRAKFGPSGYATYFMIIETMSEQKEYKIQKFPLMVSGMAYEFGVKPDEFENMLNFMINECELFEQDDTHIWSNSLLKRKAAHDEIKRKAKEFGSLGGKLSATLKAPLTPPQGTLKAPSRVCQPIREDKIREDNTNTEFEQFWDIYPKKVAKGDAIKAWMAVNPPIVECLDAVKRCLRLEDWVKEGGRYIPSPAKWIEGRRWEDEVIGKEVSKGIPYQMSDEEKKGIKEKNFYAWAYEGNKCRFCHKTIKGLEVCGCAGLLKEKQKLGI